MDSGTSHTVKARVASRELSEQASHMMRKWRPGEVREGSHYPRAQSIPAAELTQTTLSTPDTAPHGTFPSRGPPHGRPQLKRNRKPVTFPSGHGSGARSWGWILVRTSQCPHSLQRVCSAWERGGTKERQSVGLVSGSDGTIGAAEA